MSWTILSPSARKVWIEIVVAGYVMHDGWSPSARKVWIEMFRDVIFTVRIVSPSARKVWVEILSILLSRARSRCHLP